MEAMWEAGPNSPLAQQVHEMNLLLSRNLIGEEEYFCMTISLFGEFDTRDFFTDQIEHFRGSQPKLHHGLMQVYRNYFGGTEQTGRFTSDNLVEDVEDQLHLDLALALSLAENVKPGNANGSFHLKDLKDTAASEKALTKPKVTEYQENDVQHVTAAAAGNQLSFSDAVRTGACSVIEKEPRALHQQQPKINTYAGEIPADSSQAKCTKDNKSRKKKRAKSTKCRSDNIERMPGAPEKPIMNRPVIYWLRRDLRVYDNESLVAAVSCNAPVIPVFIWSELEEGPLAAGGAVKVWLYEALKSFNEDLKNKYGSQIIFTKTDSCCSALLKLVRETGSKTVIWSHMYEPYLKQRDNKISAVLDNQGIEVKKYHTYLLHEPESVDTETIGMRGVGSVQHFMACCRHSSSSIGQPVDAPALIPSTDQLPQDHTLEDLGLHLMPRRKDGSIINWAAPIKESWNFSEDAAHEAMEQFIYEGIRNYEKESSRGDQLNTARISPYVHFGQISARAVLHHALHKKSPKFRRKLAWRDMAYWLLHIFPDLNSKPVRPHYREQRWSNNKVHLKAWQKGRTGYPLVDASMRQLWKTGWMNNYMRHVVASFLISYLHIHWIEGYNWFQDTLVDADVAINAMMWQNGGMSGLDQWNFVMHPVDAAMTCDPKGDFIRAWVPELAKLPDEHIHKPWKCPPSILRRAGVRLGENYPYPIVQDLEKAREQSLQDVVNLRRRNEKQWVDRHTGNDLVLLPNGRRLPCITRREFKYKTSYPEIKDNPHSAVLKGYRSRKRDEAIAFANQRDFLASTMNECVLRQERTSKASKMQLI